jgi:hypothetical protein
LGENRYEIAHHPRSLKEIRTAAAAVGLKAKFHHDVYFGAPELPTFQKNGKENLFRAAKCIPALFISVWEKPC